MGTIRRKEELLKQSTRKHICVCFQEAVVFFAPQRLYAKHPVSLIHKRIYEIEYEIIT